MSTSFLRVLIMERGTHCQRVSLEFPTWDNFLDFKKEQEEMLFLSFSLRRQGRKTQDGKVYKSFQCCHHGHPLSWCVVSMCWLVCCINDKCTLPVFFLSKRGRKAGAHQRSGKKVEEEEAERQEREEEEAERQEWEDEKEAEGDEQEAERQEWEGRCHASLSGAKPSWCTLGAGREGHGEEQEGGGGGEDEEEEGQMGADAGHSFAQQIRELRSRNCEVKLDGGNGTRRTGLLCPSRMTVRAEQRPDGSLGRVRLEYTVTHWNHPVGVLNAMNASVWWSCQYLLCFSSAALGSFSFSPDEEHQVQPQVRQWLVQQVHDGVTNKRILEKVSPVLVFFLVLVRFSFSAAAA